MVSRAGLGESHVLRASPVSLGTEDFAGNSFQDFVAATRCPLLGCLSITPCDIGIGPTPELL